MRKIIVILVLTFTVLSFIGCIGNTRETGELIKEGKVINIEYDIEFGACFTDWRNEIYFEDGTVLWTDSDDDLSCVVYNLSGIFHFEKNYFTYDDARYKFHDFKYVEYIE